MTDHPPTGPPGDITELLLSWRERREGAEEELFPRVYTELERIALGALRGERMQHTLEPSALVNEAYLRLIDQSRIDWRNRTHFFSIAATMMRRILVDHARSRSRAKRGGGLSIVSLQDSDPGSRPDINTEILAVDSALDRLRELDETRALIVEHRFFAGLSVAETAEALGISTATVGRQWRLARAWLFRELKSS